MRSSRVSMSRMLTVACAAMLCVASAAGRAQQTELADPQAGCSAKGECNRAAFKGALAAAKTIAVETKTGDRMAAGQLSQAIVSMGKTVPAADEHADLVFHLDRINTDGVFVGPAGTALATLLVYVPAAGAPHGHPIWSETFSGQLDLSWPAVVQGLIAQLKSHAK